MKFFIDMPLSPGLAIWLARQGQDAVHSLDMGLACASDAVILERAGLDDAHQPVVAGQTAGPGQSIRHPSHLGDGRVGPRPPTQG